MRYWKIIGLAALAAIGAILAIGYGIAVMYAKAIASAFYWIFRR